MELAGDADLARLQQAKVCETFGDDHAAFRLELFDGLVAQRGVPFPIPGFVGVAALHPALSRFQREVILPNLGDDGAVT